MKNPQHSRHDVVDLQTWKESASFYNELEKILYPDRKPADAYDDHLFFIETLTKNGGEQLVKDWRGKFWENNKNLTQK